MTACTERRLRELRTTAVGEGRKGMPREGTG
jgi:hypothetical protein